MRRSLNSNELIAKYGIHRRTFDDVLELLDAECKALTLKIDKFLTENKAVATPRKRRMGSSAATSPTKTPSRYANREDNLEMSPTKRKTVLPPLPFMTPKKKITSPMKLNRVPVGTYSPASTPSRARIGTSTMSTPRKIHTGQRSFLNTPTKLSGSSNPNNDREDDTDDQTPTRKRVTLAPEPIAERTDAKNDEEPSTVPSTPSTHKSLRRKASAPEASTPIAKKARTRPTSPTPTQKNKTGTGKQRAVRERPHESESSDEDEEPGRPPCRHQAPVFADRAFYHYRDPRVLREWEACEKFLKENGVPYAQVVVR